MLDLIALAGIFVVPVLDFYLIVVAVNAKDQIVADTGKSDIACDNAATKTKSIEVACSCVRIVDRILTFASVE